MRKKTKRRLTTLFIAAIAAAAAAATTAYLHLAALLQTYAVPMVSKYAPISNFTAKVARADMDGLRLSSVSVSENGSPGLRIDDATFSLLGTKLAGIELDGLKLNVFLRDGRLVIPGFEELLSPMRGGDAATRNENSGRGLRIPFLAENASIEIKRSEISLTTYEKGSPVVRKIPYSLSIRRVGNTAKLALHAGPVDLKSNGARLKMPFIVADGTAELAAESALCRITIAFSDAELAIGKLRISGARGKIPLSFILEDEKLKTRAAKLADRPDEGRLSVDELSFGDFPSAKLALSYRRSKETGNFIISGALRSSALGNNAVALSGECAPPDEGGDWSAAIKAELVMADISPLLSSAPSLNGWKINGKARLSASAKLARGGALSTSAEIKLDDVSVSNEKEGVDLEKASLDFLIDDLGAMRSRPSQKLAFKNLKAGGLTIENGKISFQLESAKSVLLERVVLGWCGGNVDTNAFRMDFDRPSDVDVTLYCDRLNVAELLNQIKLAKAKGNGNVSGRIPLIYSDGKITVRNGFLYSTPGVGGRLALTDFMGPLASLPATIQLDITREALKDFNYEWIKLDLNTAGEDLLLKLALKGAPMRKLPFTYDKKNGGLRRSDDSNNTAKFQGISFNLNFKVPANQLMSVGRKIKELTGE